MKKIRLVIPKICIWTGVILLALVVAWLAFWRWNIENSQKKAEIYVDTLQSLIPSVQDSVLQERADNTMSVLSVDSTDFVGIIEIPSYNSALPVSDKWGQTHKYPCRLSGSIYDGTMKIGTATQKGQYDFYRELSVGDRVVYTDMEGNRYNFEISGMRYEKHADQQSLNSEEADLVIFVKNVYAFDYLVIFCSEAT